MKAISPYVENAIIIKKIIAFNSPIKEEINEYILNDK